MRLTAKEIQEKFIVEVNEVGVLSVAWMDAPGGMQAACLWMAGGGQRFWKVKSGQENEFESKLRFVEDGR